MPANPAGQAASSNPAAPSTPDAPVVPAAGKPLMRRIVVPPGRAFERGQIERPGAFSADALRAATSIVEDVRTRGDAALRDYTEKFDGVRLEGFRVPDAAIEAAVSQVGEGLAQALEAAAAHIRAFHERQRQQSWFCTRPDGALVGSMVSPLESVGVYAPGGRALYPSSVLMNAIPARVAGVERIVCVTPPAKDGSLDPAILLACRIAGVTEVYSIGGAQAIAALAYGTESIAPVVKVTGPGNAYVAAAKKVVSGDVGIDMVAGPSEVCVVADDTADPALVAIDLMAQAEHDPLASCYLVTFSGPFADAVEEAIGKHLASSPRAEITKASLESQGLAIICPDLDTGLEAVNMIAPEHLEIHLEHAIDLLGSIRNAGAIFLGPWTPEAVGDYLAGPNHTLPTGGTARFSSPLSVDDFVKKSSVIQYSASALENDAKAIVAIADHEGLWAHARSVEYRLAHQGTPAPARQQ
ncbi:MAG: histidinol dehydrogenase [Eggerthellaceae bacterium]|jgi:histidinol dehydrogenase|nr:histidinol dehydrogenase [Eggerthellaceae bacterium]MDR2715248.1 histidinol dehydrogenase [Coriobacteriaceae bacterium]